MTELGAMRPLSWLALLLFVSPSWAWDDHGALTRLALAGDASLDAEVAVESLSDFAAAAGFGDEAGLLRALELNPAARFEFLAGETPEGALPLRRVLEAYADEPDRGMDQDLFSRYPHLWKDDYATMGGLLPGTPSQSFRHMHWPQGFLKAPPSPGAEPVLEPSPLGEAPARSRLFQELSARAFRLGHPYWGARFLAWSLHYIQDLSQPYHAVQLPSPAMIYRRGGSGVDVGVTTRLVAYYHFAFELLASRLLAGNDAAGAALRSAVGSASSPKYSDARKLALGEAAAAAARAEASGKISLALFPQAGDPETLDPARELRDPRWEAELARRRGERPEIFDEHLALLADCLGRAAGASRALLSAGPAPAGRAAPAPLLPEFRAAPENYFRFEPDGPLSTPHGR